MSQSASVTHPIPPAITGHDVNSRERRDGWRAQTVITQWDPEHQLVGALMHLSAGKAAPILDLVPDTAIRGPMTRWTYELIRSLVDEGRDPDPVTVLHRAKHHPATQALHPDQPPTAEQHHGLAVHLADLYTHTVSPDAATSHVRDVLDNAYRQAFGDHGTRMQYLAENGASPHDLTDEFTAIAADLADLWRRAQAAAQNRMRTR